VCGERGVWEISVLFSQCCCEPKTRLKNKIYLTHTHTSTSLLQVLSQPLLWFFKWKSLSRVQLFATPWIVARQAPPSMGFSRQEYWSGVPFPSLWSFRRHLKLITHRQWFLRSDSKRISHKRKKLINWTLIKFKTFVLHIKKVKRQPTKLENIFYKSCI